MNTKSLIIGLLFGGLLSFGITKYITSSNSQIKNTDLEQQTTKPKTPKWTWADSLDAVKVAPNSHKIIFEDDKVRILKVLLEPNTIEPIHTHQFKSVMWFDKATPMSYYQYNLSQNGKYEITDSINIPQMPVEVLNHGESVDPEPPHAVKNTGTETGVAYRVEFKNNF
ncbi:MAG: hypothetical protein R2797_12000 [Gelidibacter sp.]